MIDHTDIRVADIDHFAAFHDAALGVLGVRRAMQLPDGTGIGGFGYGR